MLPLLVFLFVFLQSTFITGLYHSNVPSYRLSIRQNRNLLYKQTTQLFSSTNDGDAPGSSSAAKARRRRARGKARGDDSESNVNAQDFIRETKAMAPPEMSFQGPTSDNFDLSSVKSKLTPVRGTTADIQSEYQEKNAVVRYLEDLTKPASKPGEEPKFVQLIKAVTWFGVIALVLVEIFVSIKTGGGPPPGSTANSAASFPTLDQLSYPSEGTTP